MKPIYVAVDLGGTRTKFALADDRMSVLNESVMDTHAERGPTDVIDRIENEVRSLVKTSERNVEEELQLSAMGIGVPGLADIQSGHTVFLPNFSGHWRGVPVGPHLQSKLHCEVRVLNDARTATLGELRFGHGKESGRITMAYFGIGTGVGGGIVVDGKLRLGPLGAAGELGHQTILPDGPRCGCGNYGCLEAIASGPAIAAEGRRLMQIGLAPKLNSICQGDISLVDTQSMADAASDDIAIGEAIGRAARSIGIAVANIISILHPDLVVIGGGVSQIGQRLIEPIRQTVTDRVGMLPSESVKIETSSLGDRSGLLGALALAAEMDLGNG